MKRTLFWTGMLALTLGLAMPTWVRACPSCQEAIAAAAVDGDDETNNLPRAMNQAIYLMLAAAYGSFGLIGYRVVRGMKQNAAYRATQETTEPGSV